MNHVVELRRVNDRVMLIKLVDGGFTMNIISAYALHEGLDEEEKRHFSEDLDEVVGDIPPTEKLFIGGNFNGHIGSLPGGYDDVHGGFDLGDKNRGGVSLLEFARAAGMVITNSRFMKKDEHLVTFRSSVAKTLIDFLLLKKADKGHCKDCKVILREDLTTRHKLWVMDLEIKIEKKKMVVDDRLRIKLGSLTMTSANEMGERLMDKGDWGSSGNATGMWDKTANCIREVAREVFGVSRGSHGRHQGDWWWNGKVQDKVEVKKVVYVKLVESKD
ncbi:hypothetical protein K7X08_001163 [Anisodus acutangulus]|uniref:Craniofacial development protein 2-like n=1 Tax=Anisodus acutangulus TaxID=402998 RepID=A0A9Q1MRI1_9SOLA|nr:hypothetical protein K7X08_001163 [Anisodus acutangulus]